MEWPEILHAFANMSHVVMVWLNDARTIKLDHKISISIKRFGCDRLTGMSSMQYSCMRLKAGDRLHTSREFRGK
jgi:hypothetical protein